jgi:hypothetical protein
MATSWENDEVVVPYPADGKNENTSCSQGSGEKGGAVGQDRVGAALFRYLVWVVRLGSGSAVEFFTD